MDRAEEENFADTWLAMFSSLLATSPLFSRPFGPRVGSRTRYAMKTGYQL
jgi:hypothetical protein